MIRKFYVQRRGEVEQCRLEDRLTLLPEGTKAAQRDLLPSIHGKINLTWS